MRQRRFYLFAFFRFLWVFKLTPAGRILVLAIILTALGSVTNELPIYQLFCGLLALLAAVELTGMVFKPRLRLSGTVPSRGAAGEDVSFELVATNLSRWCPALDVMLGTFSLPHGLAHTDGDLYVPRIRPGETATLPGTIRCERRGIYPFPPIHAVSTFPCNLMRFGGAKTEPGRLVVLPSYQSLDELQIPVTQRYQPGGMRLAQGMGHAPEFVGNREYVPGEPFRHIDARAWARTGKPVVREYHDEYISRVALVLDTFLPSGIQQRRAKEQRLEAAVSLMAAIAERLNLYEHVIDLFAAGPEMYVFRSAGGTPHVESVLEILAGVDACRQNPFADITPLVAEELASISVVVCVFVDWDRARAKFVEQVLNAGCVAKSILIETDPGQSARDHARGGLPDDISIVTADDVLTGQVRQL